MSTKNKYSRKVTRLRETFTKEFVQMSMAYNQYGLGRPGLLDMRGSNLYYKNYPVFCITSIFLVVELDQKGELGWISIQDMSIEELSNYLDSVSEWSKPERIVTYDPFRSGDALNKHVRERIECRC